MAITSISLTNIKEVVFVTNTNCIVSKTAAGFIQNASCQLKARIVKTAETALARERHCIHARC
jgi:hypothetical protein